MDGFEEGKGLEWVLLLAIDGFVYGRKEEMKKRGGIPNYEISKDENKQNEGLV